MRIEIVGTCGELLFLEGFAELLKATTLLPTHTIQNHLMLSRGSQGTKSRLLSKFHLKSFLLQVWTSVPDATASLVDDYQPLG